MSRSQFDVLGQRSQFDVLDKIYEKYGYDFNDALHNCYTIYYNTVVSILSVCFYLIDIYKVDRINEYRKKVLKWVLSLTNFDSKVIELYIYDTFGVSKNQIEKISDIVIHSYSKKVSAYLEKGPQKEVSDVPDVSDTPEKGYMSLNKVVYGNPGYKDLQKVFKGAVYMQYVPGQNMKEARSLRKLHEQIKFKEAPEKAVDKKVENMKKVLNIYDKDILDIFNLFIKNNKVHNKICYLLIITSIVLKRSMKDLKIDTIDIPDIDTCFVSFKIRDKFIRDVYTFFFNHRDNPLIAKYMNDVKRLFQSSFDTSEFLLSVDNTNKEFVRSIINTCLENNMNESKTIDCLYDNFNKYKIKINNKTISKYHIKKFIK